MFSAGRERDRTSRRNSARRDLEWAVRNADRHYEQVEVAGGSIAVSRTVSVRASSLGTEVDMTFVPPHPTHGSRASFHSFSDLGNFNSHVVYSLADQANRAAREHDAYVLTLQEQPAAPEQSTTDAVPVVMPLPEAAAE